MSEKTSGSAPVTFTSEEQLNLRQLEANATELNNIADLISNGLYFGAKSTNVSRALSFVNALFNNTMKQVEAIQSAAKARSETSTSEDAEASKKSAVN